MNILLTFMRGVSGSGKSTRAKEVAKETDAQIVSADNYFMKNGEYNFDPALIADAHIWAREQAWDFLRQGKNVVVDNTNIRLWEMQDLLEGALEINPDIQVSFELPPKKQDGVKIHNGRNWWNLDALKGRNVHDVPEKHVSRMVKSFEWDCDVQKVLEAEKPKWMR